MFKSEGKERGNGGGGGKMGFWRKEEGKMCGEEKKRKRKNDRERERERERESILYSFESINDKTK